MAGQCLFFLGDFCSIRDRSFLCYGIWHLHETPMPTGKIIQRDARALSCEKLKPTNTRINGLVFFLKLDERLYAFCTDVDEASAALDLSTDVQKGA